MSESRKQVFVIVGIAALAAAVLLTAVWTSGALAKDYQTLRISASGSGTLVELGSQQKMISNVAWPNEPLQREVQVSGWTGSAWCPNPRLDKGNPGYVYVNYNGDGVARVTVGPTTVNFQSD